MRQRRVCASESLPPAAQTRATASRDRPRADRRFLSDAEDRLAIRRSDVAPVSVRFFQLHGVHQAAARARIPGGGLRISTPAVIERVLDQPRADGIQVDVGGNLQDAPPAPLDDDAGESPLPEIPLPPVAAVVPRRELLLQRLHELTEIPHPFEVALAPCLAHLSTQPQRVLVLPDDGFHGMPGVELPAPVENFLIAGRDLRPAGHVEQDVEMIGEHRPGDHPHAREGLHLPHHRQEHLPFVIAEQELLVDGTANTMVDPNAIWAVQEMFARNRYPKY